MYFELLEGVKASYTEELISDRVMLDKTSLGQIVGLDILGVDGIEEIGTKMEANKE
jgi:hypothetical protein